MLDSAFRLKGNQIHLPEKTKENGIRGSYLSFDKSNAICQFGKLIAILYSTALSLRFDTCELNVFTVTCCWTLVGVFLPNNDQLAMRM